MDRKISLNETSDNVFEYIFELFNQIALKDKVNNGTFNYRKRNKKVFSYYSNSDNLENFLTRTRALNEEQKKQIRNYYFRIIHQLGETNCKDVSLLVSSTIEHKVARKFSKGDIIINFWDFDFCNFPLGEIDIPKFIGKPYKNQTEISLFAVIFPHYIHSFEYKNRIFYNPALFEKKGFDNIILNGFDIDQTDFKSRLNNETIFEIGVQSNGITYSEIKK